MRRSRGPLSTAFLLVLWITGCGVKGPLIPPDMDLEKPVSRFEAFARGDELLFTWAAPDEKTRAEISGYKLFFEDADEMMKCRCRKFRELAFVDLDAKDREWVRNQRVELRLPVNAKLFGKTYHYVVVPVGRTGLAGNESPEIAIQWARPSSPPEGIRAEPGDRSVLLTWEPAGGQKQPGFNVYRKTDEEAFPLHPVNAAPVPGNRFLDKGAQNGIRYHYLVRSVTSDGPPWIESSASEEVTVIPEDLIPPAPPAGLEAIPGTDRIQLFWEESRDEDLVGYRIYRRSGGRGGFEKIGDVRHPITIFTDGNMRTGEIYDYFVAAYDDSGIPNESGPSKTVRVKP